MKEVEKPKKVYEVLESMIGPLGEKIEIVLIDGKKKRRICRRVKKKKPLTKE